MLWNDWLIDSGLTAAYLRQLFGRPNAAVLWNDRILFNERDKQVKKSFVTQLDAENKNYG